MINRIIAFSIRNKFIIGLLTLALIGFGIYSITKIPLGAQPDITNNQVQVITTSPNLGTVDIEQFVTFPVELAMANLPGVEDIRSISRFGLSVVTIVFKDNMGTYLPRQLVSEKLNEVRAEIPEEFGHPAIGPISTGLGEIYQYYLAVAPGYDTVYNNMELRTIQDWIVKRQMALVPGVVEVNTFGGHLKQYEIGLNPDRLKSMGITVSEVYEAVNKNNDNTGGAYIERNHRANFIRGEGLATSLEDLRNIVIKNINGIPILVGDVADVHYGSAVRYGAFTRDGKGEDVGGTIMMLKGANSNEVIRSVKKRIKQIQKTLPPGIKIVPFLDRSELIGRTTHTVSKNLIEGALIVIFVLVLLLGNLRGGLIVASIIPLSLLFAFILMHIFKVWANLMSLGAIDFGILIDGAVIIVEGTVHLMDKRITGATAKTISSNEMDKITYQAGSKMMNAAFFGQLIILIVFFPILALTGVEGKMFHPMALTFSFAVLGAMILCLTYVPMITSLFLGRGLKKINKKRNFIERLSSRIILGIEKVYTPIIHWSLKRGKWILLMAVLLFGLALFTFNRMGAVFIPSLDEGDLAMQAILKPGSSLTETIEACNQIEKELLSHFPEVKHVVGRIGVSEIPTDPMPMDVADMFIILKPRKEWTSAKTKEELIQKFKKKLALFPGINFQFSQPMELRFNELLTGIREDIAIKIYGDDLKILATKAKELAAIIQGIKGIGDLQIEATEGLPQITIRYNREKVAQYGLDIHTLNLLVSTAFSGKKAGQVFSGEKRFDIVLRFDKTHRESIEDIKNLYIPTLGGSQIPLKEVADISYQPGPMQISRDNTNRRIYVGVNIRGRDVETLVHEIQQRLDQQLHLPPGYYVTYGGEFQNLQRAKKRLSLVVPIALALIFLLLYFALNSFKQSLMIYMAIPLAAIGGIFSLSLRGLPFSISAGVGFIVLFGVAVLNGLVLISSLNELKEKGIYNLKERIYTGTRQRLRPILLTAVSAIMGFTPMALSTSAGSEVQRPLATVVIGGLITATLLTLVVLPILYYMIEKREQQQNRRRQHPAFLFIFILLLAGTAITIAPRQAKATQMKGITRDTMIIATLKEAESLALKNNPGVQAARLKVIQQQQIQKTALDIPKTSFYYGKEETRNNIPGIQSIGLNQVLEFPTIYGKNASLLQSRTLLAHKSRAVTKTALLKEIQLTWYHLQTAYKRHQVYIQLDSFYHRFYRAALLRYQTGETNKLETKTAKARQMEIHLEKEKSQSEIQIYLHQMEELLNAGQPISILKETNPKAILNVSAGDTSLLRQSSLLQYYNQKITVAQNQTALEKTQLLPSLEGQFAMQQVNGQSGYYSFQIGVGIPLWFGAQQGRIQAAKTQTAITQKQYEQQKAELTSYFLQLLETYKQASSSLNYYESGGLQTADEIRRNSDLAFRKGEIGYVEFIQNINHAISLQEGYLTALKNYNEVVIKINSIITK